MTRNMLNFIVDTIIAVLALLMVLTGFLLRWVPMGRGNPRTLWGLTRHEWGDVHWWIAVILIGVVVLHLALHWRWVCSMVAQLLRQDVPSSWTRRVAGVVTGVVLALGIWGFVVLAQRSTRPLPRSETPPAMTAPAATAPADLRGSTTLGQAARQLDVDLPTLRDRLGLPADTSADRRLGQIARQQDVRMSELRAMAMAE